MNHQSIDIPWKESNFHNQRIDHNNIKDDNNGDSDHNEVDTPNNEDDNDTIFGGLFADPEPYEIFLFEFSSSTNIKLRGQKQENGQLLDSTGLTLWKASILLSEFLIDHSVEIVKDKTILELGAGMGLCSILSHKLGAAHVYATDGDTDTLYNLRRNIQLSGCDPSSISCSQLIWRCCEQYPKVVVDSIVAADVMYTEEMLKPFWETISTLSPRDLVVLAYTRRNVSIDLVLEVASNHGFKLTKCSDNGSDGIYLFCSNKKNDCFANE